MNQEKIKQSLQKSGKGILGSIPVLVGTLLLTSLITKAIPSSFYTRVFTGHKLFDPLIGDAVGSISAGNPLVSYILGGEMLKQGIGLLAVTAFIVAWVTVGLIQLPAESEILGKRFALVRNVSSFILALVVAFLTTFMVQAL